MGHAKQQVTYYQLLGVAHDATQQELDVARRKAALKHHPDRGGDDTLMAEYNVAYDTLSNPKRAMAYRMQLYSDGWRLDCTSCSGKGSFRRQKGFKGSVRSLCPACEGIGRLFKVRAKREG